VKFDMINLNSSAQVNIKMKPGESPTTFADQNCFQVNLRGEIAVDLSSLGEALAWVVEKIP